MKILTFLKSQYQINSEDIFFSDNNGYWSNLNKEENKVLIESLQHCSAREALVKHQAWLEDVVYSPKRQAGLELLQLSGDEFCIDYGCMWGALTIPLAKRVKFVLGIDQTLDSLRFLRARTVEEGLSNVALLCHDIRKMPVLPNNSQVDIAIVNGVLEWVPEEGPIELKKYYGKYDAKKYSVSPRQQQVLFLKKVNENLNDGGKLYIAIENRFDFKMFLGMKDPHANILFASFLPRKIADYLSRIILGRPYVNWLYSFEGIDALLKEAGFSKADLYMCFPDYRFPEKIISCNSSLNDFRTTISLRNERGRITFKRNVGIIAEFIVFRMLKAKYFAPSIIAIAYK